VPGPWQPPEDEIDERVRRSGATKPYSAGGTYINRMSDHCGGCAFDPRKRLGEDACPFTAG